MSKKYKYINEIYGRKEWKELKTKLDRIGIRFPLFEKRDGVFFEIQAVDGIYTFERFTDEDDGNVIATDAKIDIDMERWEKCLYHLSNAEILFIYSVVGVFSDELRKEE